MKVEVAELVGSHSALKHFQKLMTSFACVMAWLVALLTVPLMLFIRVLDTKKPESTDIKVTDGLGKR